VTGLEAIYHVVEHFSMHTGQIILLTKARTGEDLNLWRPARETKVRQTLTIVEARTASEFAAARRLFAEYATALGVDLCLAGFLSRTGSACDDVRSSAGVPADRPFRKPRWSAVVGVRRRDDEECENATMYVVPARAAAMSAGSSPSQPSKPRPVSAIGEWWWTRWTRWKRRRLVSIARLPARGSPYYANPLDGVAYLELDLSAFSHWRRGPKPAP